jgi:hypothetical protein
MMRTEREPERKREKNAAEAGECSAACFLLSSSEENTRCKTSKIVVLLATKLVTEEDSENLFFSQHSRDRPFEKVRA